MYVCICNAVTERAISQLVAEGCSSFGEIQALTGCSDCCGKCAEHAETVVEQAMIRHQPRPTLPLFRSALPQAA